MTSKFYFLIIPLVISCTDPKKNLSDRDIASETTKTNETEPEKTKTMDIDWAQPPISCVEKVIPHPPQGNCPDFSNVTDPLNDWPKDMPSSEIESWKLQKRPLSYCRNKELWERESKKPGSFTPGKVETAWMITTSAKNSDLKARAVYEASRKHKMPAHILAGALTQESLFSDLGVAEDGGNYSCGIGQTNILEWCSWANKQTTIKKQNMNWPSNISCGDLSLSLVKPFYDIAITKLGDLPNYRLNKSHFKDIEFDEVSDKFPQAPFDIQKKRFQAINSFINNCSNISEGIDAKANELKKLFSIFVPSGLRNREQYKNGEKLNLKCIDVGDETYYPLHTGWILAVGSYNAGPKAIDAFAHYHGLSKKDLQDSSKLTEIAPNELSKALYYSGKYNPSDDKIHFTNLNGKDSSWNWFKLCVLQRHVGRVIQHNIRPGVDNVVENMEAKYPCAKSTFDPNTGMLVKSGVPPERQKTSGQKE